ncbi:MAG: imidazole glycerol phosphate synthase subunit HisH [Candidatus Omnitrophica bacterium]|nr:imidazole glycerol phosphate synthase subunit HisH [Candidatus Omnitrophota bacterium]
MIGIIDYGMGNVQSVLNGFEYVGAAAQVIEKRDDLSACSRIVLPGVGAFGVGMEALRKRGFIEALREEVIEQNKPFLGICLGMQLICRESFEFGRHDGLGWIDAVVRRIPDNTGVCIPHMGWDDITVRRGNRLLDASGSPDMYFVHSYYVDTADSRIITATCRYGLEFTAMIEKGNIYAVQFHPEKSQAAGLGILRRFAEVKEAVCC